MKKIPLVKNGGGGGGGGGGINFDAMRTSWSILLPRLPANINN